MIITELTIIKDHRGALGELFRRDSILPELDPAMGYMSLTYPGVVRGPHEHVYQTDMFVFFGPAPFALYLWDRRPHPEWDGCRVERMNADTDQFALDVAVIPPGVVHGYKNIGDMSGYVLNFPNKLYAGWGKRERVDEIRHEADPNSPYKIL